MDHDQLRTLLDSCFAAKKIVEEMKELPQGFKPRHIHISDAVSRLGAGGEEVRVSDVSRRLNITTPSVTKLINELEKKNVVVKYECPDDGRATLLKLTELGKEYEEKYVEQYHAAWAKNLDDISDEDVEAVVRTISRLAEAMPEGGAE